MKKLKNFQKTLDKRGKKVYNHHILNIKGCDEDGRINGVQRVGVLCEPITELYIDLSLPSRRAEPKVGFSRDCCVNA